MLCMKLLTGKAPYNCCEILISEQSLRVLGEGACSAAVAISVAFLKLSSVSVNNRLWIFSLLMPHTNLSLSISKREPA